MKNYQALARLLAQSKNCTARNNTEYAEKAAERLKELLETSPHGSGIDSGYATVEKFTDSSITLNVEYHALNDCGYYDGWDAYRLHIVASLQFGFDLRITGGRVKYADTKDYLAEIYSDWLNEEYSK